MKVLKFIAVIIVYFFYLPYLIVMLGFEMVKNIVIESINYFENTSI
jgi:hypothetical protein